MLGDTQWHVTQKHAWLAYAEPTLEVCCLPAPRRSQTQGREDKEGSLDACVHVCACMCVCVQGLSRPQTAHGGGHGGGLTA